VCRTWYKVSVFWKAKQFPEPNLVVLNLQGNKGNINFLDPVLELVADVLVLLITVSIINQMQEIKVLSLYYMDHNKLNPITKCADQYLSGLCCHKCFTRSDDEFHCP
jgi:hypothetical protein